MERNERTGRPNDLTLYHGMKPDGLNFAGGEAKRLRERLDGAGLEADSLPRGKHTTSATKLARRNIEGGPLAPRLF